MIIRALLAFVVLPGTAAIIVPPVIAYFDPWRGSTWPRGGFVVILGMFILLWCVRDFFVSGKGTLAPWDPPKHLVVVGLYKFVRNPMYVGVITLVVGWALLLQSWLVAVYGMTLFTVFHIRVLVHEEPWLQSNFKDEWAQYRNNVRRWLPRITPWSSAPD